MGAACRLFLAEEQELKANRLLEGGILRIASNEIGYVLPALQRFTKDHPNVKVMFYGALPGRDVFALTSKTIPASAAAKTFSNHYMLEFASQQGETEEP